MRACAYLTQRVILSEAKNPLNKYEILRRRLLRMTDGVGLAVSGTGKPVPYNGLA